VTHGRWEPELFLDMYCVIDVPGMREFFLRCMDSLKADLVKTFFFLVVIRYFD